LLLLKNPENELFGTVGQALFDVPDVALEKDSALTQLQKARRTFLTHIVALVRALELHFAGGSKTKTLRRSFLGFQLHNNHFSKVSPSRPSSGLGKQKFDLLRGHSAKLDRF